MKIKYKKKEVIFFIFMIICTKDAIAQNNFLSLYSNSFSNINDETIKLLLENKKPEGFYHSIIHINNKKKNELKLLYYKDVENKLTPSLSVKDLISLGIDTDFYTINKENPDPIILSDYSIDFTVPVFQPKVKLEHSTKSINKKNRLCNQ